MKADKPSTTSVLVALGCYCAAQQMPAGKIDPQISQMLGEMLRRVPQPFALVANFTRLSWFRQLLDKLMNLFIPGMFAHYLARKICIEDRVRKAIREGTRQLVVVGGGLDTLALRTAVNFPEVKVFEIDHPATQKLKKESIKSFSIAHDRITFLAADLTSQRVSQVLSKSAFNRDEKCVFLIEGVLMYLSEDQVKMTLTDIKTCASLGSKLVVTFMEMDDAGRVGFKNSKKPFVDGWLRRQKEPFVWGMAPQKSEIFFELSGWNLEALSTWEEHNASVSGVQPTLREPSRGEHVALLRVS